MTELHTDEAIFYDEATDVGRLNKLFDDLTDKRFLTLNIFTQAVRAALDLHGITLPMLDLEGPEGTGEMPEDGVWVFNVKDNHELDAESDVYLYMVAERQEEGVYACYAQLVNGEELDDLLEDEDVLFRKYPELVGDVAGETEYLKQQRHQPDVDEYPPN